MKRYNVEICYNIQIFHLDFDDFLKNIKQIYIMN